MSDLPIDRTSKKETLYATRDHYALSPQFERHMLALTAEGLESKSAIAAELAFRDIEIERLMHHVRASPSLSNQYVQLAETEIAAQRRACEELRAVVGNKQERSETNARRCDWFGEGRGQCLLDEGHKNNLQTHHHTCEQDGRLLNLATMGLAAVREAERRREPQPFYGPEVSFDTLQEDAAVRRDAEVTAVKATALPGISILDRTVTVCAACLCASCWQGAFYCDQAKTAGTVEKTIRELWQGNVREDSGYWFKDPNTGEIDYAAKSAARSAMNGDGNQT